jgi:hypothetical protein
MSPHTSFGELLTNGASSQETKRYVRFVTYMTQTALHNDRLIKSTLNLSCWLVHWQYRLQGPRTKISSVVVYGLPLHG